MTQAQPQQQQNNIWDIFSMPSTAPTNQNNNTFNLVQNNSQPQNPQQQQNNFGGFDFTNTNNPQNKERLDQQNRLNQLESALNSLNMQSQNQGNNYDDVFNKFKELDEDIQEFMRTLGRGAFGEVREVKIGNKVYAAKLVEKEKSDNLEPEKLRGTNIIKIVKISERSINEKYYDLIIMEKAVLKDIGTLATFLYLFLGYLPIGYICSISS